MTGERPYIECQSTLDKAFEIDSKGIEKFPTNFTGMTIEHLINSMKPLDNLCHPVSVIKEAEELTADAFGAEHAFFMVGGTTQAVQNMVLSVCKAGDEIIVPRNVHKSGSMSRFSTS